MSTIFDYDSGDLAFEISDNMAISADGDMMLRIGDTMALDMDSGDIHITSSWDDGSDDSDDD